MAVVRLCIELVNVALEYERVQITCPYAIVTVGEVITPLMLSGCSDFIHKEVEYMITVMHVD